MKRNLASLSGQRFDVVVVGGGIIGAGIARDAALRGLSTLLLETARARQRGGASFPAPPGPLVAPPEKGRP